MTVGDDALVVAVAALVQAAHDTHPATWLDANELVGRALATAGDPPSAAALAGIHAADLYLATACARGIEAALRELEARYLSRVPSYARVIESADEFGREVAQRLRARILVGSPGRPPRIATYSGRGPLGGWIRVAAVRLAGELAHERGREVPGDLEAAQASDPELALMKRTYGSAVTEAFAAALAALPADARTHLRLHYVDGLTIEQVGRVLGTSRATAARTLARDRQALVDGVRERIATAYALARHEVDSLLRFVRSQLELSIVTALADDHRT